MKTILWILVGALAMYLILKMLSKKDLTGSNTGKYVKELLATQQAANVIKTNEFRELVKTNEFKKLVGSLAEDQLVSLSKALV